MQSSELAELSAIVLSSARHVLPSCGLAIGEPAESDGPPEPRQVVAFMGFTGDALRGTMAIVAPFETIRHSYPLLLSLLYLFPPRSVLGESLVRCPFARRTTAL